jgi:NADH dehydrogenase [ubiquinone] 1 alpha subcomplex assembly factor 6
MQSFLIQRSTRVGTIFDKSPRITWCFFSSSRGTNSEHQQEPKSQRTYHAHNVSLVKSRDYESFLIGLLHPSSQSIQSSYFALRALHVELASIPNTTMASLRLKWFLDTLDDLYQRKEGSIINNNNNDDDEKDIVTHHPTMDALYQAIQKHNLTHRFLQRIIETRMHHRNNQHDLVTEQEFESMDEMLTFYERTYSSLIYLNLECCGVIHEDADRVASSIGMSVGIVNSIRSIGCGQVGIPTDLMDKYNIEKDFMNGPTSLSIQQDKTHPGRLAMQSAVKEMAHVAEEYMKYARSKQHLVPKEGRCALLHAVSVMRYLERLEHVKYDVFHNSIREVENVNSFQARLWRLGIMMYLLRARMTGIF